MGERTCRTYTCIRSRNENPRVWREREAEVGDHGEAIGVEGGEAECWTPGVEFERHGWLGGYGVVDCLLCLWTLGDAEGAGPERTYLVPKAGRTYQPYRGWCLETPKASP